MGATNTRRPWARHLLPHERWFAMWLLAQQLAHPNAWSEGFRRRKGPEGTELMFASYSDHLACLLILVGALVLLVVSRTRGSLGAAGFALMATAICFAVLIIVRVAQSMAASERHLADEKGCERL